MNFADRLIEKITNTSHIVVGIDPNFNLMPNILIPEPDNSIAITNALFDFSKIVIDSSYDLIPAVKFQSAYFEQFGTLGIKALSKSIEYAKNKNLLVILDAKRGDIGSTSLAYAKAYLEGQTTLKNGLTITSDITVDCMTINPFLGEDSLQPFVESAINFNKGIFILVKTSNPGFKLIQDKVVDGKNISQYLAELVNNYSKDSLGKNGYSSIGAVVGATFPSEGNNLRKLMPNAIILAPGVGSQGGTIENFLINFGREIKGVIIPISRAITYTSDLTISLEKYQTMIRKNVENFVSNLEQMKNAEK
ncbi:MAG: orotidine-5'-phosphate decarboxylase [Okeania sp. SIO2C9]|uniref:orotidine-5'-phosphate decarboxylase n=1 Tax=Okeania sp. SIO2C9 TaxID=2607791 RepID=UPI0013BF5547|nr:orotidine-5'-phosphate decarboxylase [Okeania sp. SIO2C9]NEQ77493.1 orotidine-5'-phosphate decarboxylase [Okeania sp. SIO2C9]